MCSYNRINNSYGCQNSLAQNKILKDELGFMVTFPLPSAPLRDVSKGPLTEG